MKKRGNSFFIKTLLFFNFAVIIALLLSYCATIINPLTFWYFTLFGLAYPFILLANVLFIIFWAILKRWYFIYSLLFILIGFKPLTRTFGFRLSNTDFVTDSNTLKLMTYNVHNFRTQEGILDTALSKNFYSMIKSEDPDVVGFQEFFTRTKGKFDFKDSLLKVLNTKQYFYSKTDFNDYESLGIAVFSKYPIVNSAEIQFDSIAIGNKAVFIDIQKGNKTLRVYVVHLASISFQPEDYSFINEVKKDLNTNEDVVSSKRIVKKLKNAFVKRSNEVKVLKEHIESCTTPYIIMGDFNDTPVSFALAEMTKGLKNAFQDKGSGLGVTYNGAFPNFQIDYILASPTLDFSSYKIIKKDLSDHYPVRANVVLGN
ncbi:endonuclease/exonuclease/phosphatase family protein [Pedobacter alpinus]|uniref:Endonuclease/exonuclease/phosphatase family protein n=1 Tax=Pedobacter alpinus TaxID=1590643 RepID=A0ABW5TTJ6_9SPHI